MHAITNDNPVNGSHRNNIANKTKTKNFKFVSFSNNKRDFATDDA
jgi:phage replication-related protein YjqB (UPF0714/DUF867 family)